ncbi:MAG: CPXCG motif-containing cysteine-rich protein [Gemmatimonadaceae bacterium]
MPQERGYAHVTRALPFTKRQSVFSNLHSLSSILYSDPSDFPLGDGTTDVEAIAYCPYCGEENVIAVDPGGGPRQQYVEDCQVCCRPWQVLVQFDVTGRAWTELRTTDE